MQLSRVSFTAVAALMMGNWLPLHGQEGQPIKANLLGVASSQDSYPDLSPDGRHIVFQSNRSGNWQIWIIQVDGTGLRRLTNSDSNDTMPVWSPDGSKIMFASQSAEGSERDILVMDYLGDDEPGLTSLRPMVGGGTDDMHPEWINGGAGIIFNRVYSTGDGADIIVMATHDGSEQTIETEPGWNTYASMTKMGDRLVWRGTVENIRDGEVSQNSEILSSGPDGQNPCNLTNHPAFDGWPAVSPDGKTIAFASNRSGQKFSVFLMPITGGEPRQITPSGAFNYTQPAWSSDGQSLAAYRWIEDEIADVGQIAMIDLSQSTD